jgi:acyl-homoserine lactone acylase PvdQ
MRKYVWDEFYDVNPASVPSDEVWVNLALNQPNHPIFDNKNTGKIETASDIVAQALRDAHNLLVIDNGPYQSWSWGEINKIKPMFYAAHIFPDLYDVEDYSFGGYFTTVMPIPSRNPSYGYTHAFVVEFRNQALNAYICTNSGPKTIIGNDENRLNLEMWSRMQYRSVRFATMQQPYDGNTTLILKPYGL